MSQCKQCCFQSVEVLQLHYQLIEDKPGQMDEEPLDHVKVIHSFPCGGML